MNTHYQTLILGGGLSGLTVAHKLRHRRPDHRFCVLEKAGRTGGVIRTHRQDGYTTEIGPHGFLDNCPESREILTETGLDRECVKAPLIDFVRYVYLHGRLNLIPQTPGRILRAPLIPWTAKLRVLAELWQPVIDGEPTVAKWVSHRFGPALLPYLDAVFTGTYAGDYNRLTIDSVMPGVRGLEREYGSVLRGLLAKMVNKRREKGGSSAKGLTLPAMTSFPQGMQRLPERLTEGLRLGEDLRLNTEVLGIGRQDGFWRVHTDKGPLVAQNLVVALPLNAGLKFLGELAPDLPLRSVPEAWIATAAFGFPDTVRIPPGFGYLIPEVEGRFTLGTLFSSNMFSGRAPQGRIVFETLVGGRRHPERLELDDETLIRKALADVRQILGISGEPSYTSVLRPVGAIPQLERNYPQLLAWRERLLSSLPGLSIIGFGWEGIGLNDMMKHGCRAAEAILSSTAGAGRQAEIKGIYF